MHFHNQFVVGQFFLHRERGSAPRKIEVQIRQQKENFPAVNLKEEP